MKELQKLKKRFLLCWLVAFVQGMSGWILLGKAQTLREETGAWLSMAMVMAVQLLLFALLAAVLAYRAYRRIKTVACALGTEGDTESIQREEKANE